MIARHQVEARLIARDHDVVAAFWALADCSTEPDACWRWRGSDDRRGRPVMRLRHTTVLAVRVASYAVTGRYPGEARFTHACADPRCVRPSHVCWRASVAVRRAISVQSDGYGEVTAPVHPDVELAAVRWHARGAGAADQRARRSPRSIRSLPRSRSATEGR
jgi:hypothetical protein